MTTHKPLRLIVLSHLKRYGSITGVYFAKRYGSTRLSRYVEVLRKQGHDIKCVEIIANKKYKYVLND